jgi:SAM-dependent methyltransferase/NAD(P)-dependent dehydrogenase (short-subunit alcohol dehydrogenase family)/acyl carrier protein
VLDYRGRPIAEYLGLHLKRARAQAPDSGRIAPRVRAMIHEIAWRETSAAGAQLPAPGSIAGKVTPLLSQLAESNGLEAYASFIPGLDALASAYVVRGLSALGFELKPGERFETEALRKRLGVLDKYQRLFARMLVMLAEDALLIADGGQWRVLRSPPDASADEICDQLLARHPDAAAELSLTRRCGQSLAAVLRGKADPMPLLFPEGSLAETESLYQKSPPARTYNGLIAQMFAACRAGVPADRPLRILEIGAGTGSTTAYVLEQLKDLPGPGIEYTFTDVSPLFLKRAAEKFGNPSYMRFKLFDAGADPQAQGFEAGSFDIVVGANVLHATPNLDVTVANVRKVMRPGGLLILLEGATPQRFGDLTVGLLDGWWCYTDTHRRDYALMPREGWLKLFADQGFAEAVAIPGAASGPVLSQQAIYVAQVPAEQSRAPARHIVIADRKGFALPVSQALRANGDAVEIISPDNPAGLAATLRTALGTPCASVIFLPALDIAVEDGASSDSVLADQQSLLSAALAVTQTLASRVGITARLWTVTRGGQATQAGESANPAQATLWGMSHVVALEHPELTCTRLDLDPAATAPLSAAALAAEVRGAGREDQIALRGSQRLTRRLVRHAASAESKAGGLPINGEKSYLITGGLRGLGLRVAEWLAEQGARHVALMGRGAPDDRAQQAIARLQARGVTVTVCRGDVGVRKDVERALATIAAGSAPLGGVIHAAGVLDDGVISAQTWPRFATVMGPKVTGTWHLHSLTRDLDFFVLFSSGASLAGSPGQSNHAAANAFEDALAWYRQARGLPTVSINWGPWAEIGAAADRTIGATGLRPIPPADGLAALDHAMRTPSSGRLFSPAQLAVFATDWAHLVAPATSGGLSPLFTELAAEAVANARRNPGTGADRLAEAPLPERLRSAAPNRRKTVLRDFVRQQAVKVLGMPRPEDLDVNEPLRQLGLDSLMAVELRNVLGKAVSRTLPATVTFDYPSVAALVEFLGVEVFAAELGEAPREAEAPATPAAAIADTTADAEAADLESMNEEELALQLAARLAGIGRDRD